jgi:hypothetical protein
LSTIILARDYIISYLNPHPPGNKCLLFFPCFKAFGAEPYPHPTGRP